MAEVHHCHYLTAQPPQVRPEDLKVEEPVPADGPTMPSSEQPTRTTNQKSPSGGAGPR